MAYLEPAVAFGGADAACLSAHVDAGLNPLEWRIVSLARSDGLGSLGEPGRWRRFLSRLIGARPRASLADARLEALRRFAVHGWHRGYALPVSEIKAFLAAGYTMEQAEVTLASIAGARTGRR